LEMAQLTTIDPIWRVDQPWCVIVI
jgi:hypothetical protein